MHRRAAALILTAVAFLLPGCGDRTGFVFPGSTDVAHGYENAGAGTLRVHNIIIYGR